MSTQIPHDHKKIIHAINQALINLNKPANSEDIITIRIGTGGDYYKYGLKPVVLKEYIPRSEKGDLEYQFGHCEYHHEPQYAACMACTFNRKCNKTKEEQAITNSFIDMVRGWHHRDLTEYKKSLQNKHYVDISNISYYKLSEDIYIGDLIYELESVMPKKFSLLNCNEKNLVIISND